MCFITGVEILVFREHLTVLAVLPDSRGEISLVPLRTPEQHAPCALRPAPGSPHRMHLLPQECREGGGCPRGRGHIPELVPALTGHCCHDSLRLDHK